MKKEIKLGALLGYINMGANIFVSLLYTPFLLNMMGKSEYGLYSLVASVIAYLSVLDMGFGNAMVRFVSRSQAKHDGEEPKVNGLFMFLYCIIGIIAFIIGFILISKVGFIFGKSLSLEELNKAKILILILVISVSLSFPLSVFDSYVIANEKYTYIKLFSIIKTLMKPLLMIPLLFLGFKSIAMTIIVAFSNLFSHFAMFIYCIRKLKMKFQFSFNNIDKLLLKEIALYSFFIFLNIIVDNVFNNTDQIILGIVSGTTAVSIYAVASQIVQMNTQCSTVISSLFLPQITKTLVEKDSDKKISDLFIKVSRIQIYLMLLILFGLFTFGKYFIILWAGEDYIDAYYIIMILIFPSVIPLTQNLGISVIQARNQHQFRSIVYIIIAVLNILITIPLSVRLQGVGAAIGSAIANFLGQILIMNIFYYKKAKLDIPNYWKFFLKIFISTFIVSVVFIFFQSKVEINLILYLFLIIIFTILYCLICLIFMDKSEKTAIVAILSKVKNKIIKKRRSV